MEEKEARIINPFTGRAIRVGGRTYRLVEAELLDWLDRQCGQPYERQGPRTYCGPAAAVPQDYDRRGTQYECLKKGVKVGICTVHRRFNHQ